MRAKSWLAASAVCGVLLTGGSLNSQKHTSKGQHTETDKRTDLRKAFNAEKTAEASAPVGRLGIVLVTEDGDTLVKPNHSFKTGDRFRLQITSNQPGSLYVFTGSEGQEMQQLWPRAERPSDNLISTKGVTYDVPPSPGIFRFDDQTGEEYFHVVIRSAAVPPKEPAPDGPKLNRIKEPPRRTTEDPHTSTANFLVRDPFGDTRGVVFDPGNSDSDPYLYFSAVPGNQMDKATIEFRLTHVK